MFVRLDWIRATADESELVRMREFCDQVFGDASKPCKGGKHFKHGKVWRNGVMLSWGHASGRVMLDLRGEILSSITGEDGMKLFRAVWDKGWKITRLDGALDLIGQGRSVVDNVRRACLAKQLCRIRWYKESFGGRATHDLTEKCMNIGRRKSEVCARVYDKGLEQKWHLDNWWERIEVEWKGERAMTVASALASARDASIKELTERIVGAFDFREVNGRSELARRPRVKWWADLLDGLEPNPTPPTSRNADAQRWVDGLRRSYGGVLLALKESVGCSWDDLMTYLVAGVKPNGTSHAGYQLRLLLAPLASTPA